MLPDLHVIFGGGQVGSLLASHLIASDRRVRIARRSSGAPNGVELVRGDAADREFCMRATEGAMVVYHCMNPPYNGALWEELLPVYMGNLIAAANRVGARLVVLDNLYMLGRTGGVAMNEDTPMRPCSRKGAARAKASEQLFEAHRRGDIRAVAGRASDFYGPGGELTHLGERFWRPAIAGKTARVLIDPDAVHTYHFIPDVAAGLATLGLATDDVTGYAWMLPCQPAGTLRELVRRFVVALGHDFHVAGVPRILTKVIGIFDPLVREIGEMLYQWDEPFIVDDRRFRERFHAAPTPTDLAVQEKVAWAMARFGESQRGDRVGQSS
jgi:nucleoside-diphosphate-sugar epimerase